VLDDIAAVALADGEMLRVRRVFHDDKYSNILWELDLLIPAGQEPSLDAPGVEKALDTCPG